MNAPESSEVSSTLVTRFLEPLKIQPMKGLAAFRRYAQGDRPDGGTRRSRDAYQSRHDPGGNPAPSRIIDRNESGIETVIET